MEFTAAARAILLPAIVGSENITIEDYKEFRCFSPRVLTIQNKKIVQAVAGLWKDGRLTYRFDDMPPLKEFEEIITVSKNELTVVNMRKYLGRVLSLSIAREIITISKIALKARSISYGEARYFLERPLEALLAARIFYPGKLQLILPNGSELTSILRNVQIYSLHQLAEHVCSIVPNLDAIVLKLRPEEKQYLRVEPTTHQVESALENIGRMLGFSVLKQKNIGTGYIHDLIWKAKEKTIVFEVHIRGNIHKDLGALRKAKEKGYEAVFVATAKTISDKGAIFQNYQIKTVPVERMMLIYNQLRRIPELKQSIRQIIEIVL